MAEKVTSGRVFSYKGKQLADLDPSSGPLTIIKMYIDRYPEFVNGKVESTKVDPKTGVTTVTISAEAGTNG